MSRPNTRRKKGSGTLEKRGNIWYAVWFVKGEKVRRSTGKTDKREALKKLDELTVKNRLLFLEKTAASEIERDEITKQLADYESSLPAMSVDDGFEAFAASLFRKQLNERTLYMYQCQYNRFAKWLHENYSPITELRQIDKAIAERFLHTLLDNWKYDSDTYNKYVSLLRNIWKILKDTARLTSNPWEEIPNRGKDPFSRRDLKDEELVRVVASARGEMRILFALGIYTGLRMSDCCTLDWEHIDLPRLVIHLTPRKSRVRNQKKEIIVPIKDVLYDLLVQTPASAREGYLMPELADLINRKQSSQVSNKIQRLFRSCGIQTQVKAPNGRHKTIVGFHSFRHTFVTRLINNGQTPIEIVQSLVGHKNPAMTRYYNHPQTAEYSKAIATLPNVFSQGQVIDIPSEPPKES